MFYHVKFGGSTTKGVVYVYIEWNSQNWERWGTAPCGEDADDP